MASVNFKTMVDDARAHGRPDHLRPRSIKWAARLCGLSVAQLYNLTGGVQTAPTWTVARLAKNLGLAPKVVEAALARSRAEAGVLG